MSEVKRYTPIPCASMGEPWQKLAVVEDGDYVLSGHYDAALARAEAAESRLAELQRLAREQRESETAQDYQYAKGGIFGMLWDLHAAILGEK